MGAGTDIKLLNERILTDRARQGDRTAFEELAARHVAVAWGLAGAVTRHPGLALDATAAGVAATFADPGHDAGTATTSALVPLLRATRHAALDGPSDPTAELSAVTIDGPSLDQRALLVREAFHELPERWRSALWLTEVERVDTAAATAALELAPGELTTLVGRATDGLGEQLLSGGLRATPGSECARTVDRLPGYMADDLSERDVLRVRRHLDGCERCRQRIAALDDLLPLLRQCMVPVPAALVAEARRRWAAAVVPASGPLGIALPSGRPLPIWVERAVAGTAAAVVTLGITGALITSGGRGSRLPDAAPRSTAAAASLGTTSGDGESALGATPGLSELNLEPGTAVTVPGGGSSTGRATGSSSSAARASTGTGTAGDTARSIAGTDGGTGPSAASGDGTTTPTRPSGTSSPSSPTTTAPPAGPTPTTPPTVPTTPTTEPPAPPTTEPLTLDLGVLSVTLGECSGLTVLGTPLGCTSTSTAPTELGGGLLDPLNLGG